MKTQQNQPNPNDPHPKDPTTHQRQTLSNYIIGSKILKNNKNHSIPTKLKTKVKQSVKAPLVKSRSEFTN